MSPHAATFPDSLRWLDLMLGWGDRSRWLELKLWRPGNEGSWHHPVGQSERLVDVVQSTDERWSSEILIGIPTFHPGGGVQGATAFWAVTDSPAAVARLERFKPAPSLVLRGGGSVRIAVWPLECSLAWKGVMRGNRRLAHRLGTSKKHCDPEAMWIPAPGTCLRRGRQRPQPVVVERMELDTFAPLQVVGRLRDAPDADAWRKSQRGAA